MARKISEAEASRPDDDNPEVTKAMFAKARPAAEVLPKYIGERATQELLRNKGGRPLKADKKISQTLRLDPDVLEAYKQEGNGWQTRINKVLRDHMPVTHK
jgi:uncharacterized protein (DUF4415 family)